MNLEAEYDNRAMVPEHPEIIARWRSDAATFRDRAAGVFDLSYGARQRNVYDFFHGERAEGPLAVFIHGGYWRSFDQKVFSHCAAGMVAHGFSVAVPTYTLAPDISVAGIIDEMRQFVLNLWHRYQRPLVLTGHSAGAHLVACMVATNWENFGLPANVIHASLAISGLYDLRPLLATSVNDDIRLDQVQCLMASPLFWPLPLARPADIWVGGKESSEFIRQSRSLAVAWQGVGRSCTYVEMAGVNHFTAVDPVADSGSAMVRRIVQLASS
jgi:arylformamidase